MIVYINIYNALKNRYDDEMVEKILFCIGGAEFNIIAILLYLLYLKVW